MSKRTHARDKSQTSDDVGQAEVQARYDEIAEKGYEGAVPDETPNEHYTLAGQAAELPTPETDRAADPETGELLSDDGGQG